MSKTGAQVIGAADREYLNRHDKTKFVLVVGAPFSSRYFVGPFDSFEEANDYSRTDPNIKGEFTWIVPIRKPNSKYKEE